MTEESRRAMEEYRSRQTYYDILGVSETISSSSNLYDAYRRAYDYKKNNDSEIERLNEAYHVLSNPTLRKQYDLWLQNERSNRNQQVAVDAAQATAGEEQATTEEEQATTGEEQATTGEEQATAGEEQATTEEEQATTGEEQATAGEEQATTEEEQATAGEEQATTEEEQATAGEDQATTEEEQATAGEDQATTEEEQATAGEEQATTEEEQATAGEEQATTEENTNLVSANKKPKNGKLKKVLIMGASFIVAGFPGVIIANMILKRREKLKLNKSASKKSRKIWGISTEESRLIQASNMALDSQVNNLLNQNHTDYDLLLAQAKYKNRIELIKKRIEVKQNQTVKFGGKLKYKMEMIALINQLETAQNQLQKVEEELSKRTTPKKTSLTEVHTDIEKNKRKLETTPKNNVGTIKKLQINAEKLEKRKERRIKGFKLTTKMLGGVKDGFLRIVDRVKTLKNLFTPFEKLTIPTFEQPQPQSQQDQQPENQMDDQNENRRTR